MYLYFSPITHCYQVLLTADSRQQTAARWPS